MEILWHNPDAPFESLVLAGDIGGTNTNLALVGRAGGRLVLVLETVSPSGTLAGLSAPIAATLEIARERDPRLVPTQACISAAGPVSGNRCVMTNLPWAVDGDALAAEFGIPFAVINDFLAIAEGVPTLDVEDPAQVRVLARPDGSRPAPTPATKAVIGPGTGLGVAFLVWNGQRHVPASSEGGHMKHAAFDADSRAFRDWLEARLGSGVPGVEPLVSGTGIGNLYEWWREAKGLPADGFWGEVAAMSVGKRPAAIAGACGADPHAKAMMNLFARLLGHFASDVAALLLPLGGLYLAGGVAQKGLAWLEDDFAFARAFGESYNPNIRKVLAQVPLYLIKEYSISLYGAAAHVI